MHNSKFVPTADQEKLIQSLQSKFLRDEIPHPNTHASMIVRDQSSLGTISDNLRFISQYVCSCGNKTETVTHSTQCIGENAIDSYQLNCINCGKEEKVNFHMLREALKEDTSKPKYNKRSTLYPYL